MNKKNALFKFHAMTKGLKIVKIASQTGIKYQRLENKLNGRGGPFTLPELRKLSAYLDISLDDLSLMLD